jgi:hypothetical protein
MTMNAQVAQKAENKGNEKPNTTKAGADQEKVINQLRQEIRRLDKTIKDMQHRPNTQEIYIRIPNSLLFKVNKYLSEYVRDTGEPINLSDFICEAIDIYLWAEEDNKRLKEEQEHAELGEASD